MASMSRTFAEGLKAELKRLILEGRSQVYCAYKLGIAVPTVSIWVKELGLVEQRDGEKHRRVAEVFFWSYKGLRPKEIAKKLNLNTRNVYSILSYWGAPERYHLIRPYIIRMEGLELIK